MLPNYLSKGNGPFIWAFISTVVIRPLLNSLWHCNLQHDHSSDYCWNCDINLLIKGKLRVNCQPWEALGMDNVLQTWLHLLLLISIVCTIWLHFWVDKSTEPKIGSNHTCTVPVMNIFIIAKGVRVSDLSIIPQPFRLPDWHITWHNSTEESLLPRTSLETSLSSLFWSPLGFKTQLIW